MLSLWLCIRTVGVILTFNETVHMDPSQPLTQNGHTFLVIHLLYELGVVYYHKCDDCFAF